MGLPTNINTLLSGNVVEWARIEFKESWNPDASLKTITAFANDIDNWGGGYLIIGVEDDNGRPVFPLKGVPAGEFDDIMKDLLNKCKLITPDYLPIVAPVDYDANTKLIVVWCPGGQVRPYKSPSHFTFKAGKAVPSPDSTYFIRKMASSIKPSENELNDLFSLANKIPFDDRVNHHAELSDLNITLIKSYLHEIGSSLEADVDRIKFEDLCMNMEICNSQPEFMKPRNVGLLFFSMDPCKFMPYSQIDVVEFPEGVGGDKIIEKTFKGPLHQQLRDALQYLKNSVIKEKVVKYPDRAEADRFFNYPFAALEEALANAVYHKAYDIREPIEVRVEKDKIEIVSFPGPDRSVTVEGLKNYKVTNRRYRNRRIGEFLKELHLTEGRNTGFKKILNALEKNGSPRPEFETDDEHSYFISRFFVREGFYEDVSVEDVKTTEKTTEKTRKTTEKQKTWEKIIALMKANPEITTSDLAEACGITVDGVDYQIKKLKEKNKVRRVGEKNGGHWEVLEEN